MKKISLALIILSGGAAAFHIERQSTNRLQREAATLGQSLIVETQQITTAQTEQADLTARVRELKHSLALSRPITEDVLWSELQTNRADRLSPALLERLREELGFSWQTSRDYILVSKKALRDLRIPVLQPDGKFNEAAVVTLAITPAERGQLEAAMEKLKADYKEWVLAHVKRSEPADDVVAQYSLPGDTNMATSLTTDFYTAVNRAVGEERKELIRESAAQWMSELGISRASVKLTVKRETVGVEKRLKAVWREQGVDWSRYLPMANSNFPRALRQLFPNAWADLAQREGFELPAPPGRK